MGAALVLLLVAMASLAAGILVGRYYVPDDRQLRRTARHSRSYMRALSHLIARDHDTAIDELRTVVEENVEDVEPYFALGALFRSRGEHERAIRVHQSLAVRERDRRKLRQRAMYELGLDFRAAGMPRRATRALEEVLLEEPNHEAALRVLAALYEEQARFHEAAQLWRRLAKRRDDGHEREHHLLVAAAQAALARQDSDSTKQLLKAAGKLAETAHYFTVAAELAAARGNHANARDRLKQALIANPAIAPHIIGGLIAAEQSIGSAAVVARDELADEPERSGAVSQKTSTTALALPAPPTAEVALVPSERPERAVAERVLGHIADVEAKTGPRLELALIRAELADGSDAARRELAAQLVAQFPTALAARVASARLALEATKAEDRVASDRALAELVGDSGTLAWAVRGRWQCTHCGHRPSEFAWRCSQCRRWGTLGIETGVEPPPTAVRERRAQPRLRSEGLLGSAPDQSLPAATLDSGMTADQLAHVGTRRSLLGRVGGWFSGVLRRS